MNIAYTHDGIAYEAIDGITKCDHCDQLAAGVMSGANRNDVHIVCPEHRTAIRVEKAKARAHSNLMTAAMNALGGDAA